MNIVTGFHDTIKSGDLVILYDNPTTISYAYMKPGETHETRFGRYMHDEIIGVKYGSKVYGRKGNRKSGWMYVLRPTAELWSQSLITRTQIIFGTDASAIIFNLQIYPGSVVVEAGTGSGSLSHSLARTIAPNGHLYTFEFNKSRADAAKVEFDRNQMNGLVTIEHRDVCNDGFPLNLKGLSDAVFLDLPAPWLAVGHTVKVLKVGGKVCGFSPCIEQVQRFKAELEKQGFHQIRTIECLLKTFQPKVSTVEHTHAFGCDDADEDDELLNEVIEEAKERYAKRRKLTYEKKIKIPGMKEKPILSDKSKPEILTVPDISMRSHTSYLTFGVLRESSTK